MVPYKRETQPDMKSSLLFLFVLLILLDSCFKFGTNRNPTSLDKEVIRSNCYQCHAPMDSLAGPSLKTIYHRFDEKELKHILKKEFLNNRGGDIKDHCSVVLNKKEIESIMVYLKKIVKFD